MSDSICLCVPPPPVGGPCDDLDDPNYDWEVCGYFSGGLHFVGCDKWLGSTAEPDIVWNESAGQWQPSVQGGDVCLDSNNLDYDISSDHVSTETFLY